MLNLKHFVIYYIYFEINGVSRNLNWVKIVQLIPKSHHFECDYTLITLSPKIQLNETTELKQSISFKFRNTKRNIKLDFFKTGSFPKSLLLYKIAEL